MNEMTAIKSNIPAHMRGYAGATSDVSIEDMKVPRLLKVELMSPDYKPEAQNLGHIINSINKKDYGKQVDIVVAKPFKSWARFATKEENAQGLKGLIGSSDNDKVWTSGALKGQAISADDQWQCLQYNFYVLLYVDGVLQKIPHSLIMSGTSAKEGKNFFTTIGFDNVEGLPCFARKYTLSTVETVNESKQKFYLWKVVQSTEFLDEKDFKIAEEMRKVINAKNIVVDSDPATVHTEQPAANAQKY